MYNIVHCSPISNLDQFINHSIGLLAGQPTLKLVGDMICAVRKRVNKPVLVHSQIAQYNPEDPSYRVHPANLVHLEALDSQDNQ